MITLELKLNVFTVSSQAGCSGITTSTVSISSQTSSPWFSALQLQMPFMVPWTDRGLASLKIFALASLSSWVMSIYPSVQLKYSFFREILTLKLSHPSTPTQTGFLSHNILFWNVYDYFTVVISYILRSHFDSEFQKSRGSACLFLPLYLRAIWDNA